ncbi:MAG: divergent polysaccharide deacetylase family protein [Treponema sp.]|nr:divergent polysaccharide deacetylase family protein [Treponema sp.]
MKKAVKSRKVSHKKLKKRKKGSFTEALKAFLLVGVIVTLTVIITFAIIKIHSLLNQNEEISLHEKSSSESEQTNFDFELITETKTELQNTDNSNPSSVSPDVTTVPLPVQNITSVQPTQNQNIVSTRPVQNHNTNSSQQVQNTTGPVVTPSLSEQKGALVFVIDDAGNNLRELDPFLRILGPLTIAVLPGLPYSAEAAKRIRAAGKEVILHQPMEALGAQNPGPGAIYSGMSRQEIREILSRNIEEVGPVTGINNHQGSLITMDREIMRVILDFCLEHGIYFLDSRTTADTVVPDVARQIGAKFTERNIFIDNEQNKNAMLRYIESGLTRAQKDGNVIMIGHTWSPDLALLLSEQLPLFIEKGYIIKTVSDTIK